MVLLIATVHTLLHRAVYLFTLPAFSFVWIYSQLRDNRQHIILHLLCVAHVICPFQREWRLYPRYQDANRSAWGTVCETVALLWTLLFMDNVLRSLVGCRNGDIVGLVCLFSTFLLVTMDQQSTACDSVTRLSPNLL